MQRIKESESPIRRSGLGDRRGHRRAGRRRAEWGGQQRRGRHPRRRRAPDGLRGRGRSRRARLDLDTCSILKRQPVRRLGLREPDRQYRDHEKQAAQARPGRARPITTSHLARHWICQCTPLPLSHPQRLSTPKCRLTLKATRTATDSSRMTWNVTKVATSRITLSCVHQDEGFENVP